MFFDPFFLPPPFFFLSFLEDSVVLVGAEGSLHEDTDVGGSWREDTDAGGSWREDMMLEEAEAEIINQVVEDEFDEVVDSDCFFFVEGD